MASVHDTCAGDRFSRLLQPIKDLAANWDVDVASELEDYIAELEGIAFSLDGGTSSLNFAEAALLIQGSACIYSKKVEYLYTLVYAALDFITSSKKSAAARNAAQGPGGAADAGDGKDAAEDDDEKFLSLDDLPWDDGRQIDLVEEDGALPEGGVTPFSRRVPAALLALTTTAANCGEDDLDKSVYKSISCHFHRSGALLLEPRDGDGLDDSLQPITRSSGNPPNQPPQGPPSTQAGVAPPVAEAMAGGHHNGQSSPMQLSPGWGGAGGGADIDDDNDHGGGYDDDDDGYQGDSGGGPAASDGPMDISPPARGHGVVAGDGSHLGLDPRGVAAAGDKMALRGRGADRQRGPVTDAAGSLPQEEEEVDPWEPLDPHRADPEVVSRPFRKGVTYRKRWSQKGDRSNGPAWTGAVPPPPNKVQGVAFAEFAADYRHLQQLLRKQAQASQGGFASGSRKRHQWGLSEQAKDVRHGHGLMDALDGNEEEDAVEDHDGGGWGGSDDGDDLLESLYAQAMAAEVQTELAAAVGQWKARIQPALEEQDARPPFDIHEYGNFILQQLKALEPAQTPETGHRDPTADGDNHHDDEKPAESSDVVTEEGAAGEEALSGALVINMGRQRVVAVPFADVVAGKEKYQVSRTFAAMLQLLNNHDVVLHIAQPDASEQQDASPEAAARATGAKGGRAESKSNKRAGGQVAVAGSHSSGGGCRAAVFDHEHGFALVCTSTREGQLSEACENAMERALLRNGPAAESSANADLPARGHAGRSAHAGRVHGDVDGNDGHGELANGDGAGGCHADPSTVKVTEQRFKGKQRKGTAKPPAGRKQQAAVEGRSPLSETQKMEWTDGGANGKLPVAGKQAVPLVSPGKENRKVYATPEGKRRKKKTGSVVESTDAERIPIDL
eukprot:jgi/Mesvir1/22186/Mv18787-RA.2